MSIEKTVKKTPQLQQQSRPGGPGGTAAPATAECAAHDHKRGEQSRWRSRRVEGERGRACV